MAPWLPGAAWAVCITTPARLMTAVAASKRRTRAGAGVEGIGVWGDTVFTFKLLVRLMEA